MINIAINTKEQPYVLFKKGDMVFNADNPNFLRGFSPDLIFIFGDLKKNEKLYNVVTPILGRLEEHKIYNFSNLKDYE